MAGKLLLALKAIKKAHSLSPNHPDAHINLVRLYQSYNTQKDTLPSAVKEVLESEFPTIFNSSAVDLSKFAYSYLDQQLKEKNVRGVVKGAEAVILVDEGKKKDVVGVVASVGGGDWKGWGVENATEALWFLRRNGAGEEVLGGFRSRARGRFPFAVVFRE